LESVNENSNQWKGAFSIPEVQVFYFALGSEVTLLISSTQDDVMIDIFFDNTKDSIGMSIESSILTELHRNGLVSEWGRTVAGLDRPSNSDERRSCSNRGESPTLGSSNPVVDSSAIDEKKSKLKSLASSGAKLILNGVKESADAFGPLKSVAGGLCFILDNCEVRPPPASAVHDAYRHPANEGEQAIDRIVGTPGQSACRIALRTRFRG
jgi:hypothetical protein